MTTEPNDRAAWLEQVRADLALTQYAAQQVAADRVVDVHAPAMLRALEAVEALADVYANQGDDIYAYDIRKAIDEAVSGS